MKTKDMRQRLGRKSVVSTESNNGIDGLPFVAEVKSEEPESTVVDRVIDPPELLTELDDALKDIDIHINSMEALLAVSDTVQFASDHPTTSLESAVVEFLSKRLANPHAGQQMASSTITGQLRCGADIVTFEEIATNAARSHWTSINNRINKLAQKTGALSDTTAEVGKRISEQFKTLKSQVWGYKGGNSIKVGNLVADGNTLAKAILSTQQAVALDMGLKSTLPLDRLVDNLAIKASKIIGSGKSDQLTSLSSTAVQQAQQLSNGYNAYANNDNILGFVRTGMDDELTLPQGIVSALTGAERKYNFPRYKRITSGGAKGEVELTPQLAKQLYDLGMNISRDMTEQSRAWDLRMGTLKGLGELAKTQAENIDADKNTWAAESRAASNILTMWITNTSARRYYISVYNKLASHILDILNNATVTKGAVSKEEYSQELFGFGKPKVLDMKQAISFINSNIGKVTPKTVEVETSDLGNTSDVKHITSFLDSTLKETSALISQAIPCFKQALQYMSRFEEDDDEDALDSDMLKALTPFIKYVGKGRVISHYSVSAVELRDGSYRIDGVYDNTEKHDTGVDIDSGGIRELLSYVNSTDALLQELRKVAWLDYGQSYCDWPYGIRVMLESIQRSLITICLKAIGDKVTISQELFGWGKRKEAPKPTPVTPQAEAYRTPKELIDSMQSAQFDRCDPQVSLAMLGYNTDFAKHCQLALQAYTEYKKHYTEHRYNEFVQTVNSLIDDVYNRNIESDQTISEDWKEQANGILKEICAKLVEDGVYLKFWGMTRITNGARTNFALQPNMEVGIGGYDEIPNPKLTKLQIGNVDDRVALDFLRATQDIEVWAIPKAIDSNRFIKTFSHYDDALFMSVYEAISTINQNMDNLLSFTHDLISKSIVLKDTE